MRWLILALLLSGCASSPEHVARLRAECEAAANTTGRATVLVNSLRRCRMASASEQAAGKAHGGAPIFFPKAHASPPPLAAQPTPPQAPPPPTPPQESAQPADAVPALAWVGTAKPPMPKILGQTPLPPDVLFNSAEKSVYVLVSATNLQSVLTQANTRQGSAVAVTPRIALTNCHVIHKNQAHLLVREDELFEARVVYDDENSDRCALEIKSGSLQPVRGVRPYATLRVGERVYTVGSPSGLENTLGEGIISGLRGKPGFDLVQTSAPISPGSSGGGLFDAAGNLIGITTFSFKDAQNLNFAVAADAFWR